MAAPGVSYTEYKQLPQTMRCAPPLPFRILQRQKATQTVSRSTCNIALARCLQRTAGLGRCYHQEIVVAAMAHRAVRCPWLADKELSLAFQRLSRSVLHRTQAASLVLLLPFACGHAEKTDGVRAWCCQCHIALGGGLTQAPSNRTRPRAALQRARRGPRGMWGARPAAAPLPSSLPLQLSPTKKPSEKGFPPLPVTPRWRSRRMTQVCRRSARRSWRSEVPRSYWPCAPTHS